MFVLLVVSSILSICCSHGILSIVAGIPRVPALLSMLGELIEIMLECNIRGLTKTNRKIDQTESNKHLNFSRKEKSSNYSTTDPRQSTQITYQDIRKTNKQR